MFRAIWEWDVVTVVYESILASLRLLARRHILPFGLKINSPFRRQNQARDQTRPDYSLSNDIYPIGLWQAFEYMGNSTCSTLLSRYLQLIGTAQGHEICYLGVAIGQFL